MSYIHTLLASSVIPHQYDVTLEVVKDSASGRLEWVTGYGAEIRTADTLVKAVKDYKGCVTHQMNCASLLDE